MRALDQLRPSDAVGPGTSFGASWNLSVPADQMGTLEEFTQALATIVSQTFTRALHRLPPQPTADKGTETWPGVPTVPRPGRAWHPPSQDAPLSPQGASLGPIIPSQQVRPDGGGPTGICCIIK